MRSPAAGHAALLEALADCLETGAIVSEALRNVAMAGPAAEAWAEQILRSARTDMSLATLLSAAKVIDASEHALLSADGADDVSAALLRVLVARRRRQVTRRRSIQLGLVAPLGIAALTVVIDPLSNLITGGSYVWPVFRGLILLCAVALGLLVGIPSLFREERTRTKVLGACAAMPGTGWFANLYAEEELTTVLAPFVVGGKVSDTGIRAVSVLVEWSKLGRAMRAGARVDNRSALVARGSGLESIARQTSLATGLAIVGGFASKRLAERLTERGEAIAVLLTSRARLAVRACAYALVALYSVWSLAGMVSRGIPGMPSLPGAAGDVDQKQIEELMKQLEQQ